MAALINLRQMSVLQRSVWNHFNKVSRTISTSKKNSEAAAAATPSPQCGDEPKNWVSYGFDYKNESDDVNAHNASFFFSVTLCLVFGSFMWAYAPDVHMRDWAQREAFLELRRRERNAMAPISPHYVDPKNIKLPDEEDICDLEIII